MTDSAMPCDEPERWLPVVGWEGLYEVSDLGNVRSLHKSRKPRLRGDLLTPAPTGGASPRLCVVLYRDRKKKTRLVHQLVLEAFVGPRPSGMLSLHGPGGAFDNRLANLSYGTPTQNAADRIRDGSDLRGEQLPFAKLTAEVIAECKRRYAAGETQTALAREVGVHQATVCEAINGKNWAHLVAPEEQVRPRTWLTGEAHTQAKLTWPKVDEIRKRYAAGENQYELAAAFGVSQPVISSVVRHATWKVAPGRS